MGIVFAVRHIMSKNIVSVKDTAMIPDAASLMVKKSMGAVLVARGEELVGIITEKDIMRECCAKKLCREQLRVSEVMSSPLITIDADASIGEAAMLMSDEKVRRLLVTEKGKIVGIVTERDVLRGTLSYFESAVSV